MYQDENNKKALHISKNIIAITLTIALILVFAFSEYHLTHAYADEEKFPSETEEIETETELESETEESTDAPDVNLLSDTMEGGQVGGSGNDAEIGASVEQNTEYPVAKLVYSYIISRPMTAEEIAAEEAEKESERLEAERQASECQTSESQTSESQASESQASESQASESQASESQASESQASESQTSESQTSESGNATNTGEEEAPRMVQETKSGSVNYTSLAAAFAAVADKKAEIEAENPITLEIHISLLENITFTENFVNETNASIVLDFNGKVIQLSNGAVMDLGTGIVTLTDLTYEQALAGQTEGNAVLGGISGDGDWMLQAAGDLVIRQGNFESTKEGAAIVGEVDEIAFANGYYFTNLGVIVLKANHCYVNGGFFVFDFWKGFCPDGITECTEGQTLIKKSIRLGEENIIGYSLGEPYFKVSSDSMSTYHADFGDAWDTACNMSIRENGQLVTITLIKENVSGLLISRSYVIQSDFNTENQEIEPAICVKGFYFKREVGYLGNFFSVIKGSLYMEDCTVDGKITFATDEESQEESAKANEAKTKAEASLISVMSTGHMLLKNSTVTNNFASQKDGSTDPCAGISLMENAGLELCGIVKVVNNYRYIPLPEDAKEGAESSFLYNIYESGENQISIVGALLSKDDASIIGVRHGNGAISGLTLMGHLDTDYVAGLKASLTEGQTLNLTETMSVFKSDEYPSQYLVYNDIDDSFFWDKDTYYLPEAGAVRYEFIFLLVGLVLFSIILNKKIRQTQLLSVLLASTALCFVVCGTFIGIFHITHEESLETEQQFVITDLAGKVDYKEIKSKTVHSAKKETEMSEQSEQSIQDTNSTEDTALVPNDGRDYFGILVIPELGVKLPVLTTYSEANMKTSPCVYAGELASSDLVIVGHNYDSQFAILNEADENSGLTAELYLLDGTIYYYSQVGYEVLNPDQIDEMLTGMWDMTVFTCNYTGDKRIAFRFEQY